MSKTGYSINIGTCRAARADGSLLGLIGFNGRSMLKGVRGGQNLLAVHNSSIVECENQRQFLAFGSVFLSFPKRNKVHLCTTPYFRRLGVQSMSVMIHHSPISFNGLSTAALSELEISHSSQWTDNYRCCKLRRCDP